jgi:hypothetical protein
MFLFKKWPVNCIVFADRSNGTVTYKDKCRRVIDKSTGKHTYRMKKSKHNTKPAQFENITQVEGKPWLILYSPSPGEYYPLDVKDTGLEPLNEDMKAFYADEVKIAQTRYSRKSLFDKYAPIIYLTLFIVGIFIIGLSFVPILQFMMGEMSGMAGQLQQIIDNFGKSMSTVSQTVGGAAANTPVPPPQ